MSMSVRSRGLKTIAAVALPVVVMTCENLPSTAGPEDAPSGSVVPQLG